MSERKRKKSERKSESKRSQRNSNHRYNGHNSPKENNMEKYIDKQGVHDLQPLKLKIKLLFRQ